MQVAVRQLVGWYSFELNGLVFLLLLNGERTGALTTGVGSDGSDGQYDRNNIRQTVLYRWQGSLVPVQVSKPSFALQL